jgi:hypothetical protein
MIFVLQHAIQAIQDFSNFLSSTEFSKYNYVQNTVNDTDMQTC